MSASLNVRNKDKLFRQLDKVVPSVNTELRSALEKGGDEFVEKARKFAPKDTMELDKSITWDWTKNTQEDSSRSPAIVLQAGGSATEKFRAFYARWVEFGTPATRKQPFFFPAYRLLRRKLKGSLARAMTRAIKKAGFNK